MTTLVEVVAKAIDEVQLFSRIDDWSSDRVEICRYGKAGEPEIVVVKRFATGTDEGQVLRDVVSEHRALAAIDAYRAWEKVV